MPQTLLEIMLISTYLPPSTNINNNLSLKLCIQPFLGTRRTEKVEQAKLIKHINLSPYLHPFLPLHSPFFEVEEENRATSSLKKSYFILFIPCLKVNKWKKSWKKKKLIWSMFYIVGFESDIHFWVD